MQSQMRYSWWAPAMLAGLLATALARPLVMVLDRLFVPLGLVFTLIPLVLVALVLTRNRWLMILVTLVSAVFLLGALRTPLMQERLVHPAQIGYFIVALLELLGGILATGAGLGWLVQEWRKHQLPSAQVR